MLNRAVALDIEGLTFQVELNQDDAPLAAKAFLEQLPFEGVVVHSMWSGPMGLMGPVNLNEAPLGKRFGVPDVGRHRLPSPSWPA